MLTECVKKKFLVISLPKNTFKWTQPKDKDIVEKKGQRNLVLWRYFGYLKSDH